MLVLSLAAAQACAAALDGTDGTTVCPGGVRPCGSDPSDPFGTMATTPPPSELVTYGFCLAFVLAITSSPTLPSARRKSRPGVARCFKHWPDVSAWYWSALLGRSPAPWWSYVVAEPG
jgi:hypothetical protein